MEKRETFNNKIGEWLGEINHFLVYEDGIQEEIFDLREMMEAADITDREKQIITQMQGFMLKLSFILRGKQNKTKKLLDFLKSC